MLGGATLPGEVQRDLNQERKVIARGDDLNLPNTNATEEV
jgi:hypothetical protein